MTDVSFLIPAYNEAAYLPLTLLRIRTYCPAGIDYEVIVGDHQSVDETAEIAWAMGASVCHYLHLGGTVAAVRNMLAQQATGQVLVFLDADISLSEAWGQHIESTLAAIAKVPAVTGSPCLAPTTATALNRCWYRPLSRYGAAYIGTGHLIVRRDSFDRVGGFDESLSTGEDVDFCRRARDAGLLVVPDQRLAVTHQGAPMTAWQFLRREIWHGTGDVSSWSAFSRSLPAQMGALFMASLVTALVGVATGWHEAAVLLLIPGALAMEMSRRKFGPMPPKVRFANAGWCALYLAGRGLSVLLRGSEKRPYAVRG